MMKMKKKKIKFEIEYLKNSKKYIYIKCKINAFINALSVFIEL